MTKQGQSLSLTDAAGLLGRPLVVLLTGDVPFPHQLEGRQTVKVQPVPVTEAGPFPLAVGGDAGVPAAALVDLCTWGDNNGGTKEKGQVSRDSTTHTASQLTTEINVFKSCV